jgi:hypothetical protein
MSVDGKKLIRNLDQKKRRRKKKEKYSTMRRRRDEKENECDSVIIKVLNGSNNANLFLH